MSQVSTEKPATKQEPIGRIKHKQKREKKKSEKRDHVLDAEKRGQNSIWKNALLKTKHATFAKKAT